MIAARFRLVGWVAGCAGAALLCYMASQSVAAERSALLKVDGEIASTRNDIIRLETEITARSRAGQVEHWNTVLALQAAKPAQYAASGFQLASLAGGQKLDRVAVTPVTYQPQPAAAAPAPIPVSLPAPAPAPIEAKPILAAHVETSRRAGHDQPLLHEASYVRAKPDRLGDQSALIHTAFDKPAPLTLATIKPAKAAEEKTAETKPLKLADADGKPAKSRKTAKLDDGLLPDDFGKLIAAERKAKPAKHAL